MSGATVRLKSPISVTIPATWTTGSHIRSQSDDPIRPRLRRDSGEGSGFGLAGSPSSAAYRVKTSTNISCRESPSHTAWWTQRMVSVSPSPSAM